MKTEDKLIIISVVILMSLVSAACTFVITKEKYSFEEEEDIKFLYIPHKPLSYEEFNESGFDVFYRVRFNKSTDPFTDVKISITIPKEYKECFVEYVKNNLESWFNNITLDCNKTEFEITNFTMRYKDPFTGEWIECK